MYPGDRFLLGTDLVKDAATLELAYDDPQGVTAEFNKNVLHVLNRELDANFDPDQFEHVAFWDADNEWVDIRLRSLAEQFIDLKALDMRATSPATRRCAPRSRPSSPASGSRRATRTPASSWSSGGRTRTSCTRSQPALVARPGAPTAGLAPQRSAGPQRLDQLAELVRRRDRGQHRAA